MIKSSIILKLKVIALLVFIFSIPFENWDPFGIAHVFSITKMAGLIYALTTLFIAKRSFSFSKQVFFPFKILFFFYLLLTLISIFNFDDLNTFSPINLTLFQNIIMYWIIGSDLIYRNVSIKQIMLYFILSVFLMGVLLIFGIGVGAEYVEGMSRLTFFENNANIIGILGGLSLTFVVYFILNPKKAFGKKSYYLLVTIPFSTNILLLSGSRGALISTILAIVGMFIFRKDSGQKKVLQYLFLFLAGSIFLNKMLESQVIYQRLMETTEEGDLGGRGLIWNHTLEIYERSPVIGWGNTGFEKEMTITHGYFKDTHNLFLYILVTTGIIGFVIFMYFLYLHFKSAVRFYKYEEDVIMLGLLLFYITTVFKSGGIINDKLMWILLAIIIATPIANPQIKN